MTKLKELAKLVVRVDETRAEIHTIANDAIRFAHKKEEVLRYLKKIKELTKEH